jgi:probable rRNA maturation factor
MAARTADVTLSVLVRGAAGPLVPVPLRQRLRRLVRRAMQAAGLSGAEVCLSLTDDAELRELNRTYAGEDHATDVLSFAQMEGAEPAPTGPLGDIVISAETAVRQAAAAGHSLLDELLHLSVHGLCHLLGYDHATPEEERIMFGYEARLREAARRPGAVHRVAPPDPT